MNIVITSGGTSEPIDKVRKITNMSKGTLGNHIAFEAVGNPNITKVYMLAPTKPELVLPSSKFEWIQTTSTKHVHDELRNLLINGRIDAVIHAMAVSDYTVDHLFALEDMVDSLHDFINSNQAVSKDDLFQFIRNGSFRMDNSSKVSSKSKDLYIKLMPTEKIISKIKTWSPDTILVGFKLLENVSKEYLLEIASQIKEKNHCEFVFCNDIKLIRESGHQGYLLRSDGSSLELKGLDTIAKALISHVVGDHHV